MATYDDILGGGYSSMRKTPPQVSPPPIDASLQGVPNTVYSRPSPRPQTAGAAVSTKGQPKAAAPGTDAAAIVGDSGPEGEKPARIRTVSRTETDWTAKPYPKPANVVDEPEKKQRSYVEMFQQMNPYKPPTPEEVEKEKRKQKRQAIFAAIGDGISALSNLYFTSTYSPNAFDPRQGMSAKMAERWDKLKKDREANQRAYMDGYLRAMAMDDEKSRDDRNWRHTLEREEVTDKRYDDEIAHRDKREGVEDQRHEDNIRHRDKREAVEDERWTKQFQEGVRQFNVSSAQNQQRINMESSRLAHELHNNGGVTFALGTGKGTITISKGALNSTNVAYVFNKLPESVRSQVHGDGVKVKEPVMTANGMPTGKYREVIKYGPPTTEAMLIAIGANIETCPAAQDALKEVAGQKQSSNGKGKGY